MFQYTNGFTCATGMDNESVMVDFRQKSPNFDDEGHITNIELIPIASIVMDKKTARELGEALCSASENFEGNNIARKFEFSSVSEENQDNK